MGGEREVYLPPPHLICADDIESQRGRKFEPSRMATT